MKKWLVTILMLSFAAGIAVAEEKKAPWWKLGFGSDDESVEPQVEQPQPPQQRPRMGGEREGMQSRRRTQVSEEQRAKMKAHFQEIQKLGEAARNETDPVKKEALVGELRGKLAEGAERMQAEFRKRVEKAEADIVKMKKRLEEGEKNMDKRVDEQLQRILSGERSQMKRGPGPDGKPRRKAPTEE